MKIVVLHEEVSASARPDELDVLVQARYVADHLTALGHAVETIAFGLRMDAFIERITRAKPDCVFNLVESLNGHGRLIHIAPAVLDTLKIPYTGASAETMFVTSNKLLGKTVLRGAGIPTAAWYTGKAPIARAIDGKGEQFQPGRYIIKSVWEHASVGLGDDAVAHYDNLRDLLREIPRRAPSLGGEAFAEQYIHGREFNIALLARVESPEPQVLPHAEILFEGYDAGRPLIVDYRAKWDEASYEYNHTPRRFEFSASDQPLLDKLTDICLQCWRVLNLRGYARVDFRVDEMGRPFVLEVNANPCLSPDAGFAAALAQAAVTPTAAMSRILTDLNNARLHGEYV